MWLPKEGKFILLFSNKISESGISAWATTRGRPYEIIFMQPNNNLPVCFLLEHSGNSFPNTFPGEVSPCDKQQFDGLFPARAPGKPFPEPYPGSGVALRQTIIWRYTSGRAIRTPTVTYIETDIIIYNLPDTDKLTLRTTAFRYRSVNPRPLLTSNL